LEILKASKFGFCFGVEEALNLVEDVLKKNPDKKIYILGMLVHNNRVIDDLMEKGFIF